MRILVLGVSGLIGHKILQELNKSFEVFGTLHHSKDHYGNLPLFSDSKIVDKIDVANFEKLSDVMRSCDADVILNCVGITKRKINQNNIQEAITTNSVFPHQIANWAKLNNKRVIHFSTDCVFNGKTGNYTEDSRTSAEDIYGKTKALGEITYKHTLTIRSSFIGQELMDKTELLEWFLAQNNKQVKGFTKTLYSGVSTIFMAQVVKNIISNYPKLNGLYHLAPENPIPKFDLLNLAKEAYNVNVDIVPDYEHVHVPTLDASKLRLATNLQVPTWEKMLKELASNKDFYLK